MTEEITSPLKAIRAKCLDCCGESIKEVQLCQCEFCTLHPFRFGKNPFRKKKKLSEEHIAKLQAGREAARNEDE